MQIVQALRDEFPEQVAAAAERLVEIDHESEDALVIAAVTRMETTSSTAPIRPCRSARSRSTGRRASC